MLIENSTLVKSHGITGELSKIQSKINRGDRLTYEDAISLFRTTDINTVGYLANLVRERMHSDHTFYIRNQHINYTNICNKHCKFCFFAKNPKDGGPEPYLLSLADVKTALQRYAEIPITEVHMVGGINPRLPYQYYLDLIQTVKQVRPGVHIKAFTAVELVEIARVANKSMKLTLQDLKNAGLDSVPGGGAEVLSDRVHSLLHPNKLSPSEWEETAREIARAGLPQYSTMLYGHIETIEERAEHLIRLRNLQDETGNILAFTPLAFHPEGTYLEDLHAPTGFDDLRTIAVSRLVLDNIPHIKSFWIMNSAQISQIALWYGADDIDGTIHEYEITYPDGEIGKKQQVLTRTQLLEMIQEAGRTPLERDSLYSLVEKN
jgi:aminodeoxyfutalosine synthase